MPGFCIMNVGADLCVGPRKGGHGVPPLQAPALIVRRASSPIPRGASGTNVSKGSGFGLFRVIRETCPEPVEGFVVQNFEETPVGIAD